MSLTAQSSWRNNIPLASGFHHVSNSLKFFSENMHNCYIHSLISPTQKLSFSWPAFDCYGYYTDLFRMSFMNLKFTAKHTRTCHWTLSWASWIYSTTSQSMSLRPNLILFYLHQGLPSDLFPSRSLIKILYRLHSSHVFLSYILMNVKTLPWKWITPHPASLSVAPYKPFFNGT
jgi:hypothetical protein